MKIFRFFKNRKNNKNKVYQCLKVTSGVLGIVSKEKRDENIKKYGIDMFKNPYFFCEIDIISLPLSKKEKNVLKKIGCLYFYENSKNTSTTKYNDILNFFENEKKGNIK